MVKSFEPHDKPAPRESLSQIAYESVFDMILSRELAGGTIIQERKLATSLGISRTPMREALVRLEGEGWLTRLTDRLLSVKVVDLKEFLQALYVRRLLESEAACIAATSMSDEQIDRLTQALYEFEHVKDPKNELHWIFDNDLHNSITAASQNPVLAKIVSDLRKMTYLFEAQTIPQRLGPGIKEHRAILKALKDRDPKAAANAMCHHLDRVRAGVMDRL